MASNTVSNTRIDKAVELAFYYGGIDGAHHKDWIIDRMVRALLSPSDYKKFVKRYNEDGQYEWETGIAP